MRRFFAWFNWLKDLPGPYEDDTINPRPLCPVCGEHVAPEFRLQHASGHDEKPLPPRRVRAADRRR